MPGPQHGSAHSERKVQAPTHKTGHWKGQGWDWLCTTQGKTSPFSHCHAAEGLLPSAGGWDGVEAIISASPRGVVIPAGTGWDGAGRQELGEHWDGANTGEGCQRCRCTSTSRTALYRASSAQTMGYFQCGLHTAPGLQETLPALTSRHLPVLGVTSGPSMANLLLCTVAQQCPHMSWHMRWHRLQGRQEQAGAGRNRQPGSLPSAGPLPDHCHQVHSHFPRGKSTATRAVPDAPFPSGTN